MYNPCVLSKKIESLVVDDSRKKYYRFRATGFYGGIATADTVGCNLRCKFCWSQNSVWNAKKTGQWYTPEEVAENLQDIAKTRGFHQVRVSGGEPTIGRKHLLTLLRMIDSSYGFILETNGILLGLDDSYVKELSRFPNLHVRVCLKGCTDKEFSRLTGAESGLDFQLKALECLRDYKMSFNIALVSIGGETDRLYQQLQDMNLGHILLEKEDIILYPPVKKRLREEGLLSFFQ